MEALQKVFKTFSDPTRIRILALLEREELAVQELMVVLGMAQSRVSRHLAILREASLLQGRRDGTSVFYRFALPDSGAWREAWELTRRALDTDPAHERDRKALAQVIEQRSANTRNFFEKIGPEWDALRTIFDDEALRARAISRLLVPGLRVADVGTGTGTLAAELCRLGLRVIAVDHSKRMLAAAEANFRAQNLTAIELRLGEARDLPLENEEVDAALAHMVLRYLPSPAEAIREMARVVVPGGTLVVVDFVQNQHEWMREELGVAWLGFGVEEIQGWFGEAGLPAPEFGVQANTASSRELPEAFIASARKPG